MKKITAILCFLVTVSLLLSGCAVKEAVEAGEISYDRYSSYLGMLDEEGKYR